MTTPNALDVSRIVKALESIAASLQTLAQGPTRAGKPAGESLLKVLVRVADTLHEIAAKSD